uniref:chitinase n=1 Tax=Ixodes scapularis TaxID=6945 RepID=A0A4D5S3V8_IXOSC
MRVLQTAAVILFSAATFSGAAPQDTEGKDKVFICYWGSWSHYRHANGAFSVNQIDPTLCTHLVYTFAKLENGVIKEYDPYLDLAKPWHLGMYKKFNNLKLQNPKLKTIIAIGGWNEGSIKYSKMASTSEGRAKFVKSVVDFVELHGIDGLDMDWEYPTQRGGNPEDRDNFVKLLSELRAAFDEKNYLLTAAVSAGIPTANASYDIPQLSKHLDLISVMGYDFFGAWQRCTGHNSPLRARKNATELEKIFNIEAAIEFWMSHGADTNKLVLGLPLYGRTFTLADPADSGFGALTVGPGHPGTFTNAPGFVGYNEICTQLKSGDWNVTRDPDVIAPVATKDKEWIGFDDAESLTKKVEFAMSKNLTGIMVWSIETDDFRGTCTGTANPLLSAINKALQLPQAERLPTPPTPTSTSTVGRAHEQKLLEIAQGILSIPKAEKSGTTQPQTTQEDKEQSSTVDLPCTKTGSFAHPHDRRKFYICIGENGVFKTYVTDCPQRTVYNRTYGVCVHEFL